jgi:diacylglycerol kinase family enzyme
MSVEAAEPGERPAAGAGPAPASLPLHVVLNAASGRVAGDARREAIVDELRRAGRPHEVTVVRDPAALADAAHRAVERATADGGAVVAAGGDGTINAVAQAVLGSGRPMGVLPQGTFNYFGRVHGIPADAREATRVLLRARAKPIRVGLMNERVFLVNASVGLYPGLLQDREAWKRRYGRSRLVALAAAAVTVARGYRPLRLVLATADGALPVRTPTLFVGNNPLQLDRLGLPVDESIGDGRLAAIVAPPVGALGLVWLAMRGALGDLGSAPSLRRIDVERLEVRPSRLRPRRAVDVATDGEVFRLRLPLLLRVAPEPLMLLAPAPEDAVEVR